MEKKKVIVKKKLLMAGAATLAILSGGIYWKTRVPYYTVLRAIDGDTFVTKEEQTIRLANIDAPELDSCGGGEAKKELEQLIAGKPVYLKIIFSDKYNRLVGWVYTKDYFVNIEMIKTGHADYQSGTSSEETMLLKQTAETTKNKKIGIFGPTCTQSENIDNPKCIIKGNVREGKNTKYYHYPGCEQYNNTMIQLYNGDQWFCSEEEAKKAGFVKANGCP